MVVVTDTKIKFNNSEIRFVLDKSFFHDALRTDYKQEGCAPWLFAYFFQRSAIDKTQRYCRTSSLIIDLLSNELKGFRHIAPQTILMLKSIIRVHNMPEEKVSPDYSILYLAKILFDNNRIPIITS